MTKSKQQTKPIETKLTIPVVNGCAPFNADDINNRELNRVKQPHRFQKGNKFAKGQKRGRQKLSGAFVDDLTHEWNDRGRQALQDLTSKDLVTACIAILPKDVMLSLGQADAARWVISAQPLTVEDWQAEHELESYPQAKQGEVINN